MTTRTAPPPKFRGNPTPPRPINFLGSERDLLARGLISAGYQDPLKARILLHLLIASGLDNEGIREAYAAIDDVSELDVSELSEEAEA